MEQRGKCLRCDHPVEVGHIVIGGFAASVVRCACSRVMLNRDEIHGSWPGYWAMETTDHERTPRNRAVSEEESTP